MDEKRMTVMIVDDNIANLRICKNILADSYNVLTMLSAEKMFGLLENNKPDLILLDIDMPQMNGYEAIKILKQNQQLHDIPVIFLTGKTDTENELKALALGAVDFISKPFVPSLLRKRIEVHLMVKAQKHMVEVQTKALEAQAVELKKFNDNLQKMVDEKTKNVLALQGMILKTVADLVESRDDITGGHVGRTQHGLGVMVSALQYAGIYREQVSDWDVDLLLQSSQLHDVGKIAISDIILNKPGKLTDEEFGLMKKHTTFGVKIIEKIEANTLENDFLKYAKIFVGTHHEKWDGSGYPRGLIGENIPLEGRLMAIADVYDALVSERPYKRPIPHKDAVEIIFEGRGTHFDPVLVDVFAQVAEQFTLAGAS